MSGRTRWYIASVVGVIALAHPAVLGIALLLWLLAVVAHRIAWWVALEVEREREEW